MKRVLLKVAAVLSFVATCGLIVFGQGSSTGSLSGAVTDPNKDVVANATVTVKNDATGEEFTSATADNGTFNVPALAVGVYTATISATGFKQVVATDIKVDVGKASNINVALEVGAPTEQVTIVGGTLFFTATTAHTGSELWKSDGTTEGTVPVRDISPAPVADSNVLTVGEIRVDPPTLHALGVQVLIGGDENRNGRITVRYRQVGSTDWRAGLPLMRVFPETVTVSVPHQFAGSVFDLAPATSYEIELHAVDPDGGVDVLRMVRATTRPVPRTNPSAPRVVQVTDASTLRTALSGARPGDVITLANGRYVGTFALSASGTEAQPIVIRGASTSGVVLDGSNCTGCNILEVYGGFVHVERLTIANGLRGLRFLGVNATGNVARRLLIQNVVHGSGSNTGQSNFYICDNVIDGRLQWPWVFASDASSHWDDRGIDVTEDGHVVCHNKIRGFGDPVVNKKRQARSWDVYGNDISDAWDGVELDEGEGNVRLFHNRFTNVMAPISIQPMFGGPAYALRNVMFNIPDEQIKLKSLGGVEEPSGVLIYHNTFVSPKRALNLQTSITQHNFVIGNNLFVGPRTLVGTRTVDWTAGIDRGVFDYNGYFPDGGFMFGTVGGVARIYANFGRVQSSGAVERNGVLLTDAIFQGGFVGPADEQTRHSPPDFTLAATSNAVDRGQRLPGVNDGFSGVAPDLGALELGCPVPTYGPRPEGQEGTTWAINCRTVVIEPIRVVLSRDAGGQLVATITVTNPLTDPMPGVTLTQVRASTLDGTQFVDGVPVPQFFGTVNPGRSVVGVVTFPGTSGVPSGFSGLVRVDLSYTGGTYSETKQVVTP